MDYSNKVTWFSISKNCYNQGNILIEDSFKRIFRFNKGQLLEISAFQKLTHEKINSINLTKGIIIPGCTTFDILDYPALQQLRHIKVPIYMAGGAYWENKRKIANGKEPINMIRNILLNAKEKISLCLVDKEIAKYLQEPIGVRDPYTYNKLKKKYKCKILGCSTLLIGKSESWSQKSKGYVLFGFSRDNIPAQLKLLKGIASESRVKVVIQEKHEYKYLKSKYLTIDASNLKKVKDAYKNARLVVTGRLHGVLPSISFGTPVIYFGNPPDSRNSLIKYLKLDINKLDNALIEKIRRQLNKEGEPPKGVWRKVKVLRKNMVNYCSQIKRQINSPKKSVSE